MTSTTYEGTNIEHPNATVAANIDTSFTKTDDIEEPISSDIGKKTKMSVKPLILITAEVFQTGGWTEVSVAISHRNQ